MKLNVKQYVKLGVIAVVLVVIIVANCILLEPTMAQNISGLLCPPVYDEDSLAASRAGGKELSEQIAAEGAVLVKNNGALPLDYVSESSVNVFGHASIDWVYGGSGSGQVSPEQNDNRNDNTDFLEALQNYYVNTNTDLTDMYRRFAGPLGDPGSIGTLYDAFYRLTEPSINDKKFYTDELLDGAEDFSSVALVVIGRHAGETEDPTRIQYKNKADNDTSRHYLEISTEEEELLRYLGSNPAYEKVIVIVNSTNTMELDFVDTIPGIDACLVVGATGTSGVDGIPPVLYGEISPSGHFTDTYAYDMATNVSWLRTSAQGIGHYTNGQELYPTGAGSNAGSTRRDAPAFIDYIEGVYVGYKWYETADVMGIWDDYSIDVYDNDGQLITRSGYEGVVQYPFGYGLSYTTFDWNLLDISLADGSDITDQSSITMQIEVTNTGDFDGKDVVQVYLEAPYTDGGIEKSSSALVGFVKTPTIPAGEALIVSVTLDASDFASYDHSDANANGFCGYELEQGDYKIKLMTDSHNVKNVGRITGQVTPGVFTYTVQQTIKMETDKITGNKVENRFTGTGAYDVASLDGLNLDGTVDQEIGYISRHDFPDPLEDIDPVADRTMSAEVKKYNTWNNTLASEWDNATTDMFGNPVPTAVTWGQKPTKDQLVDPATGISYADDIGSDGYAKIAKNGTVTQLGFLLGSDYNHPLWNVVLNQISLSEAVSLITGASFGNKAINSVGKPALSDLDGPSQVKSFNAAAPRGTGFPCSTVLGQTWSHSLCYSFGLNYGAEMNNLGVDGVYGFGANLHRSPWGGRNYEYLSEDGFLAGELLTEEVRGLKNTGKYTYLKHLVLYETEHERDSMYTWCNEQALREIYLKPFQKAIQEGGCVGIMSSYNRIGNTWTGGSEALIEGVLRYEWGFNGVIITDYVDGWSQNFMAIEDAVRAGGDLLLGGRNSGLDTGYDDTVRIQAKAQEVCHHMLYTYLSAKETNRQYNIMIEENPNADAEQIVSGAKIDSWEWWKVALIDLDILVVGGCVVGTYFTLRPTLFDKYIQPKTKEEEQA